MKNTLLKFAGFFVEKVPVDGAPTQSARPQTGRQQKSQRQQAQPQQPHVPPQELMQGHFPSPSGATALPMPQREPVAPLGVALRAWVPQEHAAQLAPFGLHVIAAGGELTYDQARAYGAQVLVVSAECLGSHTHLLTHPQLPTVFITPQPVLIPPRPGVVQVTEPLRASEVAQAARAAVASWVPS